MATGGEELWRECSSWLTRCGLLRADHRANWPQSTIHDLAHTLRDGVLLCNLLNVLDADSLDMKDINQRPQMAQFLCLRNIRMFLRTAHEKFELREIDLFDPSMLFDLSNFHRVLCTIAKLSQCPKALAKNIQGFSAHRTLSQEDIYKDLQSIDTSSRRGNLTNNERNGTAAPQDAADDVGEYASYCARIRDEEIYHDLCSVRGTTADGALTLRAHSHPIGSRETAFSLGTSHHSLEKRDYVIRELVDTECNYVDVLGKICKYFLKPLTSALKPSDMQAIFFGIKELHETHCGFLRQLRLATEAAAPGVTPVAAPRLGDVFLTWREKFLLYGDYCSNLTVAQDTLKACISKDDSISKLVTRCQKEHSDGRIQLRDILSVPMQRILKYHLLLDKLVQETQPNHEDFRGLERAKEAMVDVAQYINEVKRDSEVLVLLKNVQESIQEWELPEGTQLKDYGRLLLDGELKIKAHDDQKIRTRYVFIFDKVLVMCKPVKDNQYSFRSVLRLSEYRVEDPGSRRTLRGDARWASSWFLVRRSKGSAFTLYARTDEGKAKWIKAIRDAIDNLEPAGCRSTDHKFKLHTFDKPATCHHCSKFLKGRIFQGYLCTVCGACAHKACISMSGRCGASPGWGIHGPPQPLHPPSLATSPVSHTSQDASLHFYMWYVGEMGREVATARLERRLDGTFLLRARPAPASLPRTPSLTNGGSVLPAPPNPHDTQYALSLKTDNSVKHMRICRKPIDSVPHYFLSESRFFRSVVELVSYYERTSLSENFVGLNVVLRWPFRRLVATAIHDFRPADHTQLALRPGTKVLVLSKEGDARGWWKGRTLDKADHRSGYFPKDCVREDPEFLGAMD